MEDAVATTTWSFWPEWKASSWRDSTLVGSDVATVSVLEPDS
ncbi:hypothetical protein COEX109129_37235 [Corallococcus exiguus]